MAHSVTTSMKAAMDLSPFGVISTVCTLLKEDDIHFYLYKFLH